MSVSDAGEGDDATWPSSSCTVPGAVLTGFVLATAPVLSPAVALFVGIDSGGYAPSGPGLAALMLVLWLLNGPLGPVTEELYSCGHLLPRIERDGGWAPVGG